MELIKYLVFGLLTVLVLIISWNSILDVKSRKFYRFLVFESILILLLFSVDYWFTNPFSFGQIISWLLLLVSIFLVVDSLLLQVAAGNYKKARTGNPIQLIMNRSYKYIRHPLYCSLLFLGWGVYMKNSTYPGVIFIIIMTVFIYRMVIIEEAENIKKFGDEYKQYMKNSKM
ncbi:methyltransferase family protein, partial [Bacteroidota bacterium]